MVKIKYFSPIHAFQNRFSVLIPKVLITKLPSHAFIFILQILQEIKGKFDQPAARHHAMFTFLLFYGSYVSNYATFHP